MFLPTVERQPYLLYFMLFGQIQLADTSATELGQVFGRSPRLITNLERVPVGTPGAVSDEGFVFALIGAGIISIPLLAWGYPFLAFGICLMAGFSGAVIDSLLGCTLEKWKIIETNTINFLTTLIAGCLAIALYICLI